MNLLSTSLKIAIVTLLGLTVFSLASAHPVFADAKSAVCEGVGLASGGQGCEAPTDSPNVESALQKGLNLFSAVIGIIAVVMIMIGGLKFIASTGDSAQTNSAKNTIIYAAVGLVIVALAQIIVHFVLRRFTTNP